MQRWPGTFQADPISLALSATMAPGKTGSMGPGQMRQQEIGTERTAPHARARQQNQAPRLPRLQRMEQSVSMSANDGAAMVTHVGLFTTEKAEPSLAQKTSRAHRPRPSSPPQHSGRHAGDRGRVETRDDAEGGRSGSGRSGDDVRVGRRKRIKISQVSE